MTNKTLQSELSVFDPMLALIEGLTHKYEIVHDTTTVDGYALVKAGIKDVGKVVRDIETARNYKKSINLKSGKPIYAKAKEVTLPFSDLLAPMKAAKKIEDDKIAKAKQERLDKLQAKVDAIRNSVEFAQGKSSSDISKVIEEITNINPEDGFYEMQHEAIVVRNKTLTQLTTMLTEKLNFEESEKVRLELEEKQRLADEKNTLNECINYYKSIAGEFIGDTSDNIGLKLRQLKADVIKEYSFDYSKDINTAKDEAISKLTIMRGDALKMEKVAQDQLDAAKKQHDEEVRAALEKREEEIRVKAIEQEKADSIERENAAIAAQKRAEEEKELAARQAIIDKEEAVQAAKAQAELEAKEDERARLEEEEYERKIAEKKAANKAHRRKIDKEILACFAENDIDEDVGKKVIELIVKQKSKYLQINY